VDGGRGRSEGPEGDRCLEVAQPETAQVKPAPTPPSH
jgi:hypothetical protein